ncbi:hypothetical protein [Roseiconus lacunae]|uniref:hypothetical protein n=1 Tax=Roseiconus lacunae TaxID=2605694 RepID=UPI001E47235E|nr:hypothetical protein [Roseiconus lacunae]MCD0459767.1 hypothetical protein [Roseiconus lacunae]
MRYTARLITLFVIFVSLSLVLPVGASAKSPTGWSAVVVPLGDYRSEIKSMPIEKRPGRLLHVYGNTVRLNHYSDLNLRTRPLRQVVFGTNSLWSELGR